MGRENRMQPRGKKKSPLELSGSTAPVSETTEEATPEVADQPKATAAPGKANDADTLERIQSVAAAIAEPDEVKTKLAGNVAVSVSERIRDIAYHTRGGNLSAVIEEALEREAKRIEKAMNDGKPFDKRPEALKRGRKAA